MNFAMSIVRLISLQNILSGERDMHHIPSISRLHTRLGFVVVTFPHLISSPQLLQKSKDVCIKYQNKSGSIWSFPHCKLQFWVMIWVRPAEGKAIIQAASLSRLYVVSDLVAHNFDISPDKWVERSPDCLLIAADSAMADADASSVSRHSAPV